MALNFPGATSGPQAIAAQDATAAWVDFGAQLYIAGAAHVMLWTALDIGNSTGILVRALLSHAAAGDEYVAPILAGAAGVVAVQDHYYQLTDDVDQNIVLEWELGGAVPYIQFQIMATVLGVAPVASIAASVTTGRY